MQAPEKLKQTADVLREYASVREGAAGLLDISDRGRLRLSGGEAVQFLNGLITNDMKTLPPDQWMPAAFPTAQGRLIASVRVARMANEGSPVFVLDTEFATREVVFKTLQRFTFAGDFRVLDLSDTTTALSVQGAKAASVLSTVFSHELAALPRNGVTTINWNGGDVLIMRATHTGEDGFDMILPVELAALLRQTLLAFPLQPVGNEAFNILRIEAGIPRYGVDIDETLVVSETNLDDAVSFTKGCYVGQEIIARIKYRGHVAKKVTGILLARAEPLPTPAIVRSSDGKEIGRITSATYSPHLGGTIALALLKYQYLAAGTAVKVVAGDQELEATVNDLPFVRRRADNE
jgi:tRNA-modifying protein YgfZ